MIPFCKMSNTTVYPEKLFLWLGIENCCLSAGDRWCCLTLQLCSRTASFKQASWFTVSRFQWSLWWGDLMWKICHRLLSLSIVLFGPLCCVADGFTQDRSKLLLHWTAVLCFVDVLTVYIRLVSPCTVQMKRTKLPNRFPFFWCGHLK